jgi:hypothetical protein
MEEFGLKREGERGGGRGMRDEDGEGEGRGMLSSMPNKFLQCRANLPINGRMDYE